MTVPQRKSGAELFVRTLESYGVTHFFGNPGTTELPVMEALSHSDLQYVLGLHEDVAVGMAAGYASARRYHKHHDPDLMPVGVVNLHVAPGMAHGLGNLYGAMRAGAPIVVTAGAHSSDFQHEEPNLQGDTIEMTQQFTKWSAEVKHVDALTTMIRRAFRVALTPPTGPVFLALPLDVMLAETSEEPEPLGPIPNAGRGDPSQIVQAVDALVDANDPVIVVGDQIAHSGNQAIEAAVKLADSCGARVYGEMTMTEVNFPTAHELWVSRVPFDEESAREVLNSDLILFIGCGTNRGSTAFEGELCSSSSTKIDIGCDAWGLGKNRSVDIAILGDPGLVMRELAEEVEDRLSDDELARRRERIIESIDRDNCSPPSTDSDGKFSKHQLGEALARVTPESLIVDEGLTSRGAFLEQATFEPENLIGNKGGGLGYGLPAAVGAAVAESESDSPRPVLGFIGDGSYLYYPNALYSAARYDLDLTVVIPNNRSYHILKENTVKILGGNKEDYEFVGMDFDPTIDLVVNAEGYGVTARSVDATQDIHDALRWGIDEDGPTLLDVQIHDR